MKLEEQVVSLELAKEMKELGIEQNSLWWWVKYQNMGERVYDIYSSQELVSAQEDGWEYYKICSAFTVAELGEMLPEGYYTFYSGHFKTWACFSDNEEFNNKESINFIADTEADARAKMWIYLKKNGCYDTKGRGE